MDFRLLGPLEARSGDRTLPLGGPKQRAVLALLLLRANEVVAADTLIDEVWGERPPATASAYLQNCVSRLRKALGPERIETRAPGYALRAAPDEVDAHRFERLVTAARAAAPAERARLLHDALALWRGPLLADLTYEPFVALEAARFDELRLTALEDRFEADLELGRHAEVVAELEAAIAAHPLRERLRGLLMLALYRSGRQADALGAYQDARVLLIEELGLEPAEELKRLERAILAHDPALDVLRAAEPPGRGRAARRTVTVLFADVTTTTALGGAVDPEGLRDVVARVFDEADAVARKHGGKAERIAGDTLTAVFGAPVAHEDDALRAARAALDLQASLVSLNAELARSHGVEVGLRTGIESGEVVAGDAPFVTGEAVNNAKRIEEAAAVGEVLVGAGSRRLLGTAAAVEAVEPVELPGKAAPLEAFRLVGLVPGGEAIVRVGAAPLVGRRAELDALAHALDDARAAGACRLVTLVGEPGIGKSRLSAEFARSLGETATVLSGRCVAYGDGATYLPLAEIVRQAAGTDVRARIAELVGGDDGDVVADRVAAAVGGGAAAGGETFWAARRFLEALARERPLVVILEDLHWAEPTFLDLVEYLAAWSRDAPILLLCVARPELLELRPAWAQRGVVALDRLDDADAAALLDALRGGLDLPDAERALIVERGDGNPLFIEHLLAYVRERGPTAVPPSLEALLAARLDRLEPEEREVLERAAVVGRDFTRGVVDALTQPDVRIPVGVHLMALVRKRLVLPDRSLIPGEDGFRFHHALVRDVAYAATPKARRAELHHGVATWLDERGGAADEVVGTHLELAYRCRAELGRVDDEALAIAAAAGARLGGAGMSALRRNDPPAAVNLLARATALLPERSLERLELHCELGTAYKAAGDYRAAEKTLDAVIAAAADLRQERVELRARIERVWPRLLHGDGNPDDGVALAEGAIPVFERYGDERGLGRAWLFVAAVRGRLQWRNTESEHAARRAVEYALRTGFSPPLAMLAADVFYGPTPVPAAIARCEELLALAGADRGALADLTMWLGWLEGAAGRFEPARARLRDARRLLTELGYGAALVRDWVLAATDVELLAGEPEAAESLLREACDELDRAGDSAWLATLTAVLAEAVYAQGRFPEALALSQTALELATRGDLAAELGWRCARAKALARAGEVAEGETLAREALALLAGTDVPGERAKALLALAEVLRIDGRGADADAAAAEAAALLARKGYAVQRKRREPGARAPSLGPTV